MMAITPRGRDHLALGVGDRLGVPIEVVSEEPDGTVGAASRVGVLLPELAAEVVVDIGHLGRHAVAGWGAGGVRGPLLHQRQVAEGVVRIAGEGPNGPQNGASDPGGPVELIVGGEGGAAEGVRDLGHVAIGVVVKLCDAAQGVDALLDPPVPFGAVVHGEGGVAVGVGHRARLAREAPGGGDGVAGQIQDR